MIVYCKCQKRKKEFNRINLYWRNILYIDYFYLFVTFINVLIAALRGVGNVAVEKAAANRIAFCDLEFAGRG